MQYPLRCCSHWLSFFFSDPRGITITPSPFGYSLFEKSESLLRVTKSLKGSPIAKKLFYKYFFAIDNVYTGLGNLFNLAAVEVVDAFDSLAVCNYILNTGCLCTVECREYHFI